MQSQTDEQSLLFSEATLKFFRRMKVAMGAVILVPGVLSFSWRIGEHLSWRSLVVSVSVTFETVAHLSLVISILVFNIAVFFRDPLSMSNMPILTLTTRVGFHFRLHSSANFFFISLFVKSVWCLKENLIMKALDIPGWMWFDLGGPGHFSTPGGFGIFKITLKKIIN